MAFRKNSSQQYSLMDVTNNMTAREQKALEKSWAKVFADEIFPIIDEDRFKVLYSDRTQCRANTPVNVIIGALIIKEMFQISDDEVVENLMLDPRYQYALHTTSYDEQPLSDKSLSRFRKRCYDYETAYGVDLLHDCVKDLSAKIAKIMKINPRIKRMDSMMIEANIKLLSRAELIYTCIAKLVILVHKKKRDDLIEGLEHYYHDNDYNQTFYYSDNAGTEDRIAVFLKDADKLLVSCKADFEETTEYSLLVRCLSEQTIVENDIRRLRTKEDGGMGSTILQNPSDPDATYREKAGKKHRGYVGNLVEDVGENGSVITDYQLEQNIHSDSDFMKEYLASTEKQDEKITVSTDGAYYSDDNATLAKSKNIELVPTALTGIEPVDIYADFELNEKGDRIVKCPMGYVPKSSCSSSSNGRLRASFPRETCANCPHKDECKAKVHKKTSCVEFSAKANQRARQKRFMKSDRFKDLARLRNGVETLPSILRRLYNADHMQVRGKIKTGFYFGCKVMALNFRKLFTFRNGLGRYAQNPLLTTC